MAHMTVSEVNVALARCIGGNICRYLKRRPIGADVETERCNIVNLGLYAHVMAWDGLTDDVRYLMECKAQSFCHCLGPCKDSPVVALSDAKDGSGDLKAQIWQEDIVSFFVVSLDEKPITNVTVDVMQLDKGVPELAQRAYGVKQTDTVFKVEVRGPLDADENYQLKTTIENSCGFIVVSTPITVAPCAVTVVTEYTNVTCVNAENGTITLTPSGGTAPYSYAWHVPSSATDPGDVSTASHLVPGTYTIDITDDAGCSTTVSVTITQPLNRLTANVESKENAVVSPPSNGSVTMSVSGGTGPYTYQWYNANMTPRVGQTGLTMSAPAGTYFFVVTDANGCEFTYGPVDLGAVNT